MERRPRRRVDPQFLRSEVTLNIVSVVRPSARTPRCLASRRATAGRLGLAAALGMLALAAIFPATLSAAPPSGGLSPGGLWLPQGPGPTFDGQNEGIENGEVVGAIHTVAANPHTPSQLYAGAVNGGIWRTVNATSQNVKWRKLTDDQLSNSIGALEFDPTDPGSQTLVAGIGRFSSFSSTGGARTGLLRTTDSGASWQRLDGGGVLIDKNISGVAARGQILVAAVNTATPNTTGNIGIWRSADGGATFQHISLGNGSTTGLPVGITFDLVGDPVRLNRLFTSVTFAELLGGTNGVYRSDDTGATWTKVSSPAMDALLASSSNISNVELAVGRHNNVYAAIVRNGRLFGVFRSGDGGSTWTAMDLPSTNEGVIQGAHPGGQGSIHLSLAADPDDPNILYLAGDRQPLFNEGGVGRTSFPNSIGANDFSGRIFRGDASRPAGSQWVHMTHSATLGAPGGGTASNTAPHADSREMAIDAAGNLIETDDGGIYKRTHPRDNTGDWFSLNGDIQTAEMHDVAYDTLSKVIIGGDQDTGVPIQLLPGEVTWSDLLVADGGDVAVDTISTAGTSFRYSSTQNLGNFNRTFWDAANNFLGFTFPRRTVIGGGAAPSRQFVTPVKVNNVDGLRLVLGMANGVYESLDQGETIRQLLPAVRINATGADPLAYGAAGNPDVIYAGSTDSVYVRTAPYPGGLVKSNTFPGTGTGVNVTDIAIDPDDPNTAFVANLARVFKTSDAGATWTEITGSLPALAPSTLRSIALAKTPLGNAVAVGTQNGLYFATENHGYTNWQRLGNGLPTVPVFDLHYDRGDDLLVASTMGRGAWKLVVMSSAVLQGGL
jgi:photosystem II stability/assembly factor-like uncharacterized protein